MQSRSPSFGQRTSLRQPTIIRRPSNNPEPQVLVSHAAAPLHAPTKTAEFEQPPHMAPMPAVATEEPAMEAPPCATSCAALAGTEPQPAAAVTDRGSDGRWAQRTPSRLGGQIVNPGLLSPIPCLIRDTSSTGARLELQAQRGGPISRERVPDQFMLFMPTDRVEVECQVMWRQGQLLGIRYTSPARRTAKQQPIKKAEQPKKPHTSLINLLINPL